MGLIDVDKLVNDIAEHITVKAVSRVLAIIQGQPIVDAEPVRHGHWIKNDNGTYSCSKCQSWIPNEQHYYARYCLYCGAKMDEEKENGR